MIPGVVESLKIITEKASTRVAKFAFEFARKFGRKKIHAIHKANIMKLSDGLFLTRCARWRKNYPDIEYKELIMDNACMQMVLNPNQFDMLLLTNLYGDIMSDLAAGLIGGLGFAPSGNMGETIAVFEAVHGTAPDIAGKGIGESYGAIDERDFDVAACSGGWRRRRGWRTRCIRCIARGSI